MDFSQILIISYKHCNTWQVRIISFLNSHTKELNYHPVKVSPHRFQSPFVPIHQTQCPLLLHLLYKYKYGHVSQSKIHCLVFPTRLFVTILCNKHSCSSFSQQMTCVYQSLFTNHSFIYPMTSL